MDKAESIRTTRSEKQQNLLQELPASKPMEVAKLEIQPSIELVVVNPDDGKLSIHALPQSGRVTIGRGDKVDIRINALSLSRIHAAIHVATQVVIEDLGSTNGTEVQKRAHYPVSSVSTRKVQLFETRIGDYIRFGSVVATIRSVDAASTITTFANLVAKDAAMKNLYEVARDVAESRPDLSIMIRGEIGAGKKALARTIHETSSRATRPLIVVNCGELSFTSFDREFLGHKERAVSNANKSEHGYLEHAHGGTLLLENVEKLPLSLQLKLARILETHMFVPVGATEPRPFDVRFIATMSKNLDDAVAQNDFLQDLYHRLREFELEVPPLRSRTADIIPLARQFLEEESAAMAAPEVPELSPEVVKILEEYHWPGNVRELRNVMTSALTLCRESTVRQEHLPQHMRQLPEKVEIDKPQREQMADERQRILAALHAHGGNLRAAAAALGIALRTLYKRLDRYSDIPRPKKPKTPLDGSA